MTFLEFVDRKQREAIKQIGIIKNILEIGGFKVSDHLDDEEPFVYVYSPVNVRTFEGIRIYKVGNQIAYRVQNQENAHPYGASYSLDVEDMFEDLLGDELDEDSIGNEIMTAVISEIRDFFEKSASAEVEDDGETDPLGKVIVSPMGSDYSSTVLNTQS